MSVSLTKAVTTTKTASLRLCRAAPILHKLHATVFACAADVIQNISILKKVE